MDDVTKCKHWRWMPGMLAISTNNYHRPARVESIDGDAYGLTIIPGDNGPIFASHNEWGIVGDFPRGCTVPDLTDPATLGCLLHLVREAWAPNVVVFGGWPYVAVFDQCAIKLWKNGDLAPYLWESDALGEAEALVAALEAAP